MYDSIYLTFWKSQHHWNKNRSVVARDQKSEEELTAKGHEESFWGERNDAAVLYCDCCDRYTTVHIC